MTKNDKKLMSLYMQKDEDFEYADWRTIQRWDETTEQLRLTSDQELDAVHPEAKARMLIAAIVHDDREGKQRLIASGIHPNPKDFHEGTPLHAAAYKDDVLMLEYLLSIGSDLKAKDSKGRTPLHIAAYEGASRFIKHLAKLELMDCTIEDVLGRTPVEYSILGGHFGVMNLLSSLSMHQNKLLKGSKTIRWTALHDAAIAGKSDEARFLLGIGMNPNLADKVAGKTPLHFAVREGRYDVAVALLTHDADPRIKDKKGRTAIHELARSTSRMNDWLDDEECRIRLNFRGLLRALGDFGSTMTEVDDDGNTPLHLSVLEFGFPNAAKEFIRPESINAANKEGFTPLHFAASLILTDKEIQAQLIEMLLDAGADERAVALNGETPLSYGNPFLVESLSRREAARLISKTRTPSSTRRSTL